MIKINFKLTNELKNEYLNLLNSSKFGNGRSAKTIKERFNAYSQLSGYFNFEDIIFVKPCDMDNLINKMKELNLDKDRLKDIFNYTKFQPLIAKFIEKHLNPTVCYYCNIDFINVFDENENKNKFTLDHFIDKANYPFLALSFYNLIPSCYVCNSKKIKGTINFYENENLKDKNPYSENFNFDERVKFKLFLSKSSLHLNVKSKSDIIIPLKEKYTNNYDEYIKVFKLNERYEAHRDMVFDMIKNMGLYPDSRLKELQDLTGIPYIQIKQDIFNLVNEEDDLSKRPLSKLIKDIANELGII